ncbi:MAG: DoxX family protein [Pedosphaera sp.]|nr:DoxX family protein [Pedosphaera sp.]
MNEMKSKTMKTLSLLFKTNKGIAPLIMRLGLAGVMFPHGAQKLLGWFGGYGFDGTMQFFTQTMHIPAALAFLAIVAEFFGSLALVFGLFSRVAAFGIGTVIAVAASTVALPNGFFMNWFGNQKGEGIEYHILMVVLAAGIVIQGGGQWAIDSLIHRRLVSGKITTALPSSAVPAVS